MAAKRTTKQRKKNGGGRGPPPGPRRGGSTMIPRPLSSQLDAQAAAYAHLLNDPCGAKLSHPVYAGGEGGYLMRVESDAIISNGADTGSMGYWCPGNPINGIATMATQALQVVSDTAVIALTSVVTPPGKTWLIANAAAVRCVSACIQVSFPGKELDRSGFVGLGQSTYGRFSSAAGFSTSGLRTLAERVRRMPDGLVEIKLIPNLSSANYVDPNGGGGAADLGMPTLFWSVFGVPPNTGIRIRAVAVYEWLPQSGVGLTLPNAATTSESRNTLNDVLRSMKSWGDWAYSGFHDAADAATSLIGAARAGRALVRGSARAGALLLA